MSRTQHDQVIDDDEEETCPLCVEEFDLMDKGFRPCPCGYQICQFCYHNVKTNMNGLCPACRRPYNDEDIEYKLITPEETAAHKARQAQKQKKTQAALQKEKQKAEADNLSRKHLAGLRVVQKNLVYVTGLNPTNQEDQLLQTLRGEDYFGQYGKIIKIVVSKAKDLSHPNSVGVYVTFERKEDAQKCINAVDGTKNQERTLRAQFGTTKYCSAYLRGENCTNRSCMFLHEPGEANESYSRADLSALNAGSSNNNSGRAPPPQSQQPIASASQPASHQATLERSGSPPTDRPALPSSASWATRPTQQQSSRVESRSTSGTMDSPAPAPAMPATAHLDLSRQSQPSIPVSEIAASAPAANDAPQPPHSRGRTTQDPSPLFTLIKHLNIDDLKFTFPIISDSQSEDDITNSYPPLFDVYAGAKRRSRRQREEEQRLMNQEAQAFQQPPAMDEDEHLELSGSLQLGGEPEERRLSSQPQSAIQPPGQEGLLDRRFQFGGISSPPGIDRGFGLQQHQQASNQSVSSPSAQNLYMNGFQQQNGFSQHSNPPGHQRNASRYSFANESTASTAVKPVANAKLLTQQSSMMPSVGTSQFAGQQQPHSNQFYTNNVQGPPPGLKATGTPPVSGGMTFGQGHGFATGGLQYGANIPGRNANEEMMRNLLRGRESSISGGTEAAKLDADVPPITIRSRPGSVVLDESRHSTPPVPPGFEGHASTSTLASRSVPTIPPGLGHGTSLPGSDTGVISRPQSRAGPKRTASQITPALPLRLTGPGTPKVSDDTANTVSFAKAEENNVGHGATSKAPKQAAPDVPPVDTRGNGAASASPSDEIATRGATHTAGAISKDVDDQSTSEHARATAETAHALASEVEDKEVTVTKATPPKQTVRSAFKVQTTAPSAEVKTPSSASGRPKPLNTQEQRRTTPTKPDNSAVVNEAHTRRSPFPAASVQTPVKSQKDAQRVSESSKKAESPGTASPAVKPAPRTLRVVPMPKAETPPPLPLTMTKEPASVGAKQPSRQPSVASIHPPGTPSSEQVSISDAVSVASTSLSRPNSPPPILDSKASTASFRGKSKSQQKRERQERAKALELEFKESEATKAGAEEPAQEAIVSRKKKTKKEKEKEPAKVKSKTTPSAVNETASSTPAATRPTSPEFDVESKPSQTPEQYAKDVERSSPSTPMNKSAPSQVQRAPSPPQSPALTAAQLLADFKATAPSIQKCIDSLFRTPTSPHYKASQSISARDIANPEWWNPNLKVNLTGDEITGLLNGTTPAIHYGGDGQRLWNRGMVTPTGVHLRALTAELEMRFLELEEAMRKLPEDLKFRPSKPQNEFRFPKVDLQGALAELENKGHGVSVMEQMVQDGSGMKKGAFLVDEAGRYLDGFVMPPVTVAMTSEAGADAGDINNSGGGGVAKSTKVSREHPPRPPPAQLEAYAERALAEARKSVEDGEATLRKAMKKNRKILGLV